MPEKQDHISQTKEKENETENTEKESGTSKHKDPEKELESEDDNYQDIDDLDDVEESEEQETAGGAVEGAIGGAKKKTRKRMREVSIADLKETLRRRAHKLELLLETNKESNEGINKALNQMRTLSHLMIVITKLRKLAENKEEIAKNTRSSGNNQGCISRIPNQTDHSV